MECYENVLFKGAWFNLFMYDQMHKINKKTAKQNCLNWMCGFQNVHFINDKNPGFVVYGHITLKTPVLVRSPKLSNVEPG